jgi:hypothetical protein
MQRAGGEKMRTFAQQLAVVGFRPSQSTTPQEFAPVRASQRPFFEPKSFEKLFDELIDPLIKIRKVQVTYRGGIYRARHQGLADFAFGDSASQATSSLKLFSNVPRSQFQLKENF